MQIRFRKRGSLGFRLAVLLSLIVTLSYCGRPNARPRNSRSLTQATRHFLSVQLAIACMNAEVNKALSLLSDGANPNARDKNGRPVIFEALHNSDAILQALVAHGSDIDIREPLAQATPLMYAAAFREAKTIKFLLAHGAKINLRNSRGDTALSKAAYSCGHDGCASNADTGRELIKSGADVNAKNKQGNTPLMLLTEEPDSDSVELAKTLISHGAKSNLRNKQGKTALQMARSHLNKDDNTLALIRLLSATSKAVR